MEMGVSLRLLAEHAAVGYAERLRTPTSEKERRKGERETVPYIFFWYRAYIFIVS